jgi:hypothetical protein
MNSPARWWIVLLLGVQSVILTPKAFSQVGGGPFGPYLTLTDVQTTNVGGMCYATFNFTNSSQYCIWVTNAPVVRSNSTNLSTTFTIGAIPGCFQLSDPGIPRAPVLDTVVLGSLDPGQYSFQFIVSGSAGITPWPIVLTIPAPAPNTKMLALCQTNGAFMMNVQGVANVGYVVQSSCDFTNWTDITTNTGAPFNVPISATTNSCAYYRVRVLATQ